MERLRFVGLACTKVTYCNCCFYKYIVYCGLYASFRFIIKYIVLYSDYVAVMFTCGVSYCRLLKVAQMEDQQSSHRETISQTQVM